MNDLNIDPNLRKDSYVAFDAISIRNLILKRMNDQGIFVDQNYLGSNLAVIIDIVSYAFNTLMFYLNRTSSEATFTEAQLFENITKIVKILDYKPVGYQTSNLPFVALANFGITGVFTIPRYSYIMTDGVSFSFNEDVSFSIPTAGQNIDLTELNNRKLLYQGSYRENAVYTAAGDPNEVVSFDATSGLIDHFNIDVYVYEVDESKWFKYTNVNNIYTEKANSRSFEKTLTPTSYYEISFGNGINGRRLKEGDKVAIYYLQSSGTKGVVGPGSLQNSNPITYYTTNFAEILKDTNTDGNVYLDTSSLKNVLFDNVVGSTFPKNAEDAESIRKNAPSIFKSQYRLITKEDFKSYISTNFAAFISDVEVFSNWEYTAQYLKYFHDINVNPAGFGQILLNQVQYADSCNFNNVYICATPRVSRGSSLKYILPAQKELIISNIESLKCLTTEISFLDPIYKAVSFGVRNPLQPINIKDNENTILQIIKHPSSKRSIKSIQNEVISIFKDFFNPVTAKLGGVFDYARLVNRVLSVEGVGDLKTINKENKTITPGICLYMWNPTYPDLDKSVVLSNRLLERFEYLYFQDLENVDLKIEVVESIST